MIHCENCGAECDTHHHLVHWESIGEVEIYCDNCHQNDLADHVDRFPFTDTAEMTDDEINSILQL